MSGRLIWLLSTQLRKVWVRVAGFAVLAVASLGAAHLIGPHVSISLVEYTGADAVEELLGVLASSMLAVTTFSLSIAVSAFSAAAGSATPRATALLQQDPTTQNVLATFLGAFVFGLLGKIALAAGLYDRNSQLVLFLVTLLVIGWVIFALIRWISLLMNFGRMGDTLKRVEDAAVTAIARRRECPFLGAQPFDGDLPSDGQIISARAAGYVQHIDMAGLQQLAEEAEIQLYLQCMPGSFVFPGKGLLVVGAGQLTEEQAECMHSAVVLGDVRTFTDDPRFGLIVLAEIASRALSPAVNDPGTAIDVIGRCVRLLSDWQEKPDISPLYANLHVPATSAIDLMDDAFRPIARDSAGVMEVQIRLLKGLAALKQYNTPVFAAAADSLGQYLVECCENAATSSSDLNRIKALQAQLLNS